MPGSNPITIDQSDGTVTRRTAIVRLTSGAAAAVVAGVATPALAAIARTGAAAKVPSTLPKTGSNFLWGTATAAHQVEGSNVNSDVWLLEQLPGSPFSEPSGDACDHYHRYEQDIALLARLGFNSYRFSVEWARIEPARGQFSAAEIAHYRSVLEACRRNGLHTVVTLHHFTSPRWFAAAGGFERDDAVALFSRYAAHVVETLGDLIDCLCTFNEANLTFGRRPAIIAAAAAATGSPAFSCFLFDDTDRSKPIIRAAHAAARTAVKALRPTLPVGLTLAMSDYQAALDTGAAGQAKASAARSQAYDVWLEAARADDFVGVQTYTRELFSAKGPVPPPSGSARTQIRQEYYPPAIGGTIRYAAQVARVPIVVTENGVGIVDDASRVRYIDGALEAVGRCIADGVDVRGYLHWSAMDNYEWLFGYGPKFGLIAVDRTTQVRTVKPSGHYLGRIARRQGGGQAQPWLWRPLPGVSSAGGRRE